MHAAPMMVWRWQARPAAARDQHGVVTLVADSFDEHVGTASKDVLVQFYAPWYCPAHPHPSPLSPEPFSAVNPASQDVLVQVYAPWWCAGAPPVSDRMLIGCRCCQHKWPA